jgi:hypothetical protein
LAQKELPIKYPVVLSGETSKLMEQEKLLVEVSYSNEDNKKQIPIKIEKTIDEMKKELDRRTYKR